MPNRRPALALAGLVVVMLTAGGCTVTGHDTDHDTRRETAERVLGDGLSVDLAKPPSRGALGLADGQRSTVLQREDRAPFEVTVRFRDGHILRTSGEALIVTADSADDPPSSLTVRRTGLSQDDLSAVLSTAVDDLGADRARADAVREQSAGATSGPADVIRTLPTGVAAPDRLEVESVVSAKEGRVSVNYLVAWQAR